MAAKKRPRPKRATKPPAGVTYLVTGPENCYGIEPGGTFFIPEIDRIAQSHTIAALLHRHLIIIQPDDEVVSDDE